MAVHSGWGDEESDQSPVLAAHRRFEPKNECVFMCFADKSTMAL